MKKWGAVLAAGLVIGIFTGVGFFFDLDSSSTSTHSAPVSQRQGMAHVESPRSDLHDTAAPERAKAGQKVLLVAPQSATSQPLPPSKQMGQSQHDPKGPSAIVAIGSRNHSVTPNSLGLFPRIALPLGGTANISAAYPDGQPGDLVIVQAEDGGSINGGPPVAQMHLDEVGALSFAFTSTHEGGVYRVTLRNGFDEKRLEFWGGPEPAANP